MSSFSLKRSFLNDIFNREAEIMLNFYTAKGKGKSPVAKKYKGLRDKIKNIDQEKIDLVLDEYFWKVCYAYYRRQMRIWVILTYKYLNTRKMSAKDRWLLAGGLCSGFNLESFESIQQASSEHSTSIQKPIEKDEMSQFPI